VPLLLDWGFPEGLLPDYNMDVDAFEDEETIPETPKEAITKPGDIWILGEHRLMCGDSTKIDNVEILMNNKKADLVFTDPPYNLVEKNKLIAKNVHKSINRLNNSGWDKEFKILPVLDIIQNFTNKDCSVYIFTSNHLAGEIWLHFRSWADHYNWCVWSKTNPMPSLTKRHWTWSGELICYATKGKHVFNFPKEGNAYSIWEFGINTKDRGHPTAKPIEVCLHGILHSSNENQLILDLFGGSGSTLIACEKSKRKCLMMEIDPIYCDVIIARWEKLTGQKAQLERKINA
jgi:DNA modification methylase